MTSFEFLRPRFNGTRFRGGEIPADGLKELVIIRDMILEQARWQYKEQNPDIASVPNEFSIIDLKLTGIEDGSARPILKLTTPHTIVSDRLPHHSIFEDARDRLINFIKSLEHRIYKPTSEIAPKTLSYFNQLGKRLLDDESVEFNVPGSQTTAKITGDTHRWFVEAIDKAAPVREATLRGTIHKIDQKNKTFVMQQIHGLQITGPLSEMHRESILDAFNGYRTNTKIQIRCTIRDKLGQPIQIQSIIEARLLDQLDVPAQLDEMRGMKDGWMDGCGTAPSRDGLDWLSAVFSRHYPRDAAQPHACPTPEGGINMEWSVGRREIGLEIDLKEHRGEWSWDDMGTGASSEKDLHLDERDSWEWIANQIQAISRTSE